MQLRHSLRFRILFSYLIFGISIGGVMALVHYISLDELEEIVIHEYISDEMHYFIDITDKDTSINQFHRNKIIAYKKLPGEIIVTYPFLNLLNAGFHEEDFKNHTYTILINDKNDYRYYVLYDETDFAKREDFLLITLSLSIGLAILFSLWFGFWISGKIISPLARLATQVDQLQAQQLEVKLSQEYADDEVGKLAKSFDEFMDKLILYVERERSFTADASHELRTPLAIIQGAVEVMLEKGHLAEEDTKRLERIERAARDMSQNLTALLLLARAPSKETVIEAEVDLVQIIEDIIDSYESLSTMDDIKLHLDLGENTAIYAPANIISVLISNLIRNAFLYTEKGTVKIKLENNKLEITDTGIGISEEDLSRIFEQGYRGTNALGQGSGLGLSLAKRICDYYNWHITIESIKGKGTTVTWNF